MTLESVYYLTGIIFYMAWIALLVTLTIVAIKLYDVIRKAPDEIKQKLAEIVPPKRNELLSVAGMVATTFIMNRLKNMFKRQ